MSVILLMNMLIAMMNTSYETIRITRSVTPSILTPHPHPYPPHPVCHHECHPPHEHAHRHDEHIIRDNPHHKVSQFLADSDRRIYVLFWTTGTPVNSGAS